MQSCDHPALAMNSSVFSAQVTASGFAITPQLILGDHIDSLVRELSHPTLRRSRAGARHVLSHRSIHRLANDPRLLLLAREVLGSEAIPFRCTLFDKSLTANWLVVWHQDTALPLRQREEALSWGPWSVKDGINYAHAPATALENILALRLHLDDSTSENGPLRMLPGTHKLGVLTDEQIQELTLNGHPVDCRVEAGGVLAMRPLVLHASSKSRSGLPRRVLHFEYAASPQIASPLELLLP
jgi:ectoine hydroxylase-related dioxygenase (phytanoyl-CoA dioxygenase family)